MGIIHIYLSVGSHILSARDSAGNAVESVEIYYCLITCYLRNDVSAAPYIGGLGAVHGLAGPETVGAVGVAGVVGGIAAIGKGLDLVIYGAFKNKIARKTWKINFTYFRILFDFES